MAFDSQTSVSQKTTMPGATRHRSLRPRRRRPDEEGEDEGSTVGDQDDFSMSEGSAVSNVDDDADIEGSDITGDDDDILAAANNSRSEASKVQTADSVPTKKSNGSTQPTIFKSTADTEAMMKGLKISEARQEEELQFDQTLGEDAAETSSHVQDRLETPSQKSRREHLEYIKERNSNPAFVPTRGGFFLHDDRTSTVGSPHHKQSSRGRGRGYGAGYGASRNPAPNSEPADRQWAHDLHDAVNKSATTLPARATPASSQIPTAKPAITPPNRTFSVTTVLGNVVVHMSLPHVEVHKTFRNVTKKQYTLLPQHRPPLRRDKPVRISIPNEPARYIFPSTERSFIFIPRALRPNQQTYSRGRGRGSFHGSRRPSVLGGSVYTPSVGMSRKSSMSGVPPNGLHTPTESLMRGSIYGPPAPRPIVRMPMAPMAVPFMPPAYAAAAPLMAAPVDGALGAEYGTPGPAVFQSPPTSLPMHQPRPQKAVSVAEIEEPTFKPPQQQQEQPFHQQMPAGMHDAQSGGTQSGTVGNAPLSHIPEGAVYAQPFQPYPMYPPGGYYNMPYPPGQMFFPPNDGMNYGMSMGGPVMAPQFMPVSQAAGYGPATPSAGNGQPAPVVHETNGMVYYLDPSQYPMETNMPQYNGGPMVGLPQYYPSMQSGVYYPPSSGQ